MKEEKGRSVAWILAAAMLLLTPTEGLGPLKGVWAKEQETASRSEAQEETAVIRRSAHPVGQETVEVIEYGEGEDWFQVSLPANTEGIFDFIMDPQELIGKTDAAAYGDLVFEEGATLFFKHNDGAAQVDHSSTSDTLTIANTGTVDAEVSITAEILSDTLGGIVLTDDPGFTDDTEPSLYLALTDGTDMSPILMDKKAYIDMTLEGCRENRDPSSCRFHFVGAVNKNGDWSLVEGAVPKLVVTWSVKPSDTAWTEDGDGQADSSGQADSNRQAEDSGQTKGGSQADSSNQMENNSQTENNGQADNNGQTDSSSQADGNGQADSSGQTENNGQADGNGQTENNGQADGNGQTENNGQAESSSQTDSSGQTERDGQTEDNDQADGNDQTESGSQTENNGQAESSSQTDSSGQTEHGDQAESGGQAEHGDQAESGGLQEKSDQPEGTMGRNDAGGVSDGAGPAEKTQDGTGISGTS